MRTLIRGVDRALTYLTLAILAVLGVWLGGSLIMALVVLVIDKVAV